MIMSNAKPIRDPERLDLPSASKLERTVNCPGSHRLELSLPPEAFEQKDEALDEMAQRGTRIHEAFETGQTLNLDAEELEIYQQGVKHEEAIVQRWMRDKALDDCEEGPREMRVFLHDPVRYPEMIGSMKLDRHYLNRERGCVLITDLKSGFNPNLPASPHSWQLRFGAVVLWVEEYGDWMKEARVSYCRASSKVEPRDFCDYAEQDLKYSWESIRYHLWEATQPDAQLRPGAHCGWCPCKAWCLQAGAFAMLPTVTAKRVPRANEMTWELMVEHMAPTDLARVWEMSSVAGKIIEAVKARLKAMPADDLAKLGIDLGEGRKIDPITDVAGAWTALTREFSEQDILACMEISKGDLAELVRNRKGKTKADASKWISENLSSFITPQKAEAPLKKITP